MIEEYEFNDFMRLLEVHIIYKPAENKDPDSTNVYFQSQWTHYEGNRIDTWIGRTSETPMLWRHFEWGSLGNIWEISASHETDHIGEKVQFDSNGKVEYRTVNADGARLECNDDPTMTHMLCDYLGVPTATLQYIKWDDING